MAISLKGRRRIAIGGRVFYWDFHVAGNKPGKGPGGKTFRFLDPQQRRPRPIRPITPATVRHLIETYFGRERP